ncbi:MAG: AMMECR1 domain-containing protein, partial [Candidatus Nealsonbacteria bacterium CG02_land_8_20_14_3_00_40_11]
GLLLPDLDGVDTAEQQLNIACLKGGINPEKEKTFIYKFTVEKYNIQ